MERFGFLHDKICNLENIEYADRNARKNKHNRKDIIEHDKNRDVDNMSLFLDLLFLDYHTSEYDRFKIYERKEREIFKLPYFPDRIAHHAIMNILEPIWTSIFIDNTYSSIKGRGIHKVCNDLKKVLRKYPNETTYCLKLDIRKFYPSIDHDILYEIIQRKIKDPNVLKILKEIIDSADRVPIGNYLSQYFATLYLTYFDHWIKETLKCKFYFRYADDIVILDNNKERLREILTEIEYYLTFNLKLELKPNYQIFPVEARGIDFVGYKFFHTHTLLRKSIKIRINNLIKLYKKNKIDKEEFKCRMSSYFGWLKFCDSKNFLTKIESETGVKFSNWDGKLQKISSFYNKKVYVIEVIKYSTYFQIHCIFNNKSYSINSKNKKLYKYLSTCSLPKLIKIKPNERTCKNTYECNSQNDREIGKWNLLLPF